MIEFYGKKKSIFTFLGISIIILSFFLCGCGEEKDKTASEPDTKVIINMPEDDTVNGYRKQKVQTEKTNETKKIFNGTYYVNKNSKKFHFTYCSYASKISDENLFVSDNREQLISEGYSPCSSCKP